MFVYLTKEPGNSGTVVGIMATSRKDTSKDTGITSKQKFVGEINMVDMGRSVVGRKLLHCFLSIH